MRRHHPSCTFLLALVLLPTCAFAQQNNNRVGSTGSSFGGTGGSGGLGGASSGFGSSGFGSSNGFGSSGFGTAGGMGAGGMGAGGMGSTGMSGMGGQTGLGQNQQGGNFIGGNANQQQFLGTNGRGQGQGMGMNGMMNQLGNANRGNRGNMNTMNSMFGNGNSSGSNNSASAIRPRQKVAFEYPVPQADALQSTLQSQLTRISLKKPSLSNVLVSTNPGGEVVLRGAVKSESDARLAASLVRIEPGVQSVRNELTFPPPADGKAE